MTPFETLVEHGDVPRGLAVKRYAVGWWKPVAVFALLGAVVALVMAAAELGLVM